MSTKKKVLYLITKSSWGGAQRYVYDLATNIDKEKYEPIVALGGTDELYDRLRDAGLQVIKIKGLSRDVSVFKDLIVAVHIIYLLFKERPDVLHVNSSKVGVLGTFFGRLLLVPKVIFTCHGWAFNEDRPSWQRFIIKLLQWFTVLCSHTTIVVSSGVKKDMDWPLVQTKMKVIPLGRSVPPLYTKEDARELLSMKVSDHEGSLYDQIDDLWLGTIAELHPTKCLHIAIEAVAQLRTNFPTLRYIIIHDGEERPRLETLIKNLDLSEHVYLLGTLPDAAKLLKAFDVFVLPSRSEAFGYVLLEAGAASVPVVASSVGGIPDIITHEKTGLLVPPEDVVALTEAVRHLLSDEDLRRTLGTAHHGQAATFTLDRMVTATENLYEAR